jgi:hypothetical protein
MNWRPLPGGAKVARGAAHATFTLKGRHLKHGTNPPGEVTTVAQTRMVNGGELTGDMMGHRCDFRDATRDGFVNPGEYDGRTANKEDKGAS